MARISEKSPLYRPKTVICEDIAHVLNDRRLHHCAKFAVIDQAIWIWSEFDGKYKGCRLWSEEALLGDPRNGPLVHEHPVPRKEIRDRLFGLNPASPQSVRDVMEKYCLGVVITKREDLELVKAGLNSSMPKRWRGSDVFARYRKVGIRVRQVAA